MQGVFTTKTLAIPNQKNMTLIEDLKWRYATKRYNSDRITDEQLSVVLESIRLAPTSLGLQPFKIIQVDNTEIRQQLRLASFNQPQLTEASHVLIFAVWTQFNESMADEYLQLIADTRHSKLEDQQGFKKSIMGYLGNKPSTEIIKWASNQAYIALGNGLVAAASLRIDATPIEGFKPDEVNALLNLNENSLHAAVIMTLGHRDIVNDPNVNLSKVRRPIHQIVEII